MRERESRTVLTQVSPAPTRVTTISFKLPPFRPSVPEVWFAQIKAQFATRGITAQWTKFEYMYTVASKYIRHRSTQPFSFTHPLLDPTTHSEGSRLADLVATRQEFTTPPHLRMESPCMQDPNFSTLLKNAEGPSVRKRLSKEHWIGYDPWGTFLHTNYYYLIH